MPLCDLSRQIFVQYFGGLYEHSTWVVERAYDAGLTPAHDNPELLSRAFQKSLANATVSEKLSLLLAHPGSRARLDHGTEAELTRYTELSEAYRSKFGFPFIMKDDQSSPPEILNVVGQRLANPRDTEINASLVEINRIARVRLDTLLGKVDEEFEYDERTSAGASTLSAEQLRDPDYFPGVIRGLPLGLQHVLAMFVSNVTPAIIIAGAVGFGFGSSDTTSMVYLIQMSMFFAGVATLMQTIGLGPVGARLPIVQGTSFAFIPVMIPIAKVYGMAALMGGIVIGGVFHFFIGTIIGRIRHWLPPLVTGLVVLLIGLALVKVGIQYAAGGVPLIGKPEYGSFANWGLALIVIVVTLALKFFTRGMLSVSAVLLGLLAGYAVAWLLGLIDFGSVGRAGWFALPDPTHFGFEVNLAAVVGMCLMGLVSAIETVGDISGITKGGAGREATDKEVAGGTMADGLGTAVSGIFGALPNTSFSQNVGLISMTGVMSRHVVTLGAVFLILCGLVPKIGAAIQTMPIAVLGGGVIIMFGMVAAAGVNMLADVHWNRRNMVIFAIALSIGLGLQLEPGALQHLPDTLKVLMSSGLLPAALIAITLNLIIPQEEQS